MTTSQLADCGLSRWILGRLVDEGVVRLVRPGVYAVGGRRASGWEAAMAAGLLVGPDGALSHATAAGVHRLPQLALPADPPELSVSGSRHPRLAGVVVHRVRHLDPLDVVTRHGVQVTSPERTMVDLADRLGENLLVRVVDEGCVAGLWTPASLTATLNRLGGSRRPGSAALRSVLVARCDEPAVETFLELRVVRLLAPFAPFETQHQVVIAGDLIIIDIAWPDLLVAVEADGWQVRTRSYSKFERGQRRNNLLVAAGWHVVHVTSGMDDQTIVSDVGRVLVRARRRAT